MVDKKQTQKGCLVIAGIIGFAFLAILILLITSKPEVKLFIDERVVTESSVKIYTGPGLEFELDASSPTLKGERIYVLEDNSGWLKFSMLSDDTTWVGFIQKEFTENLTEWNKNRYMAEINAMQKELGFNLIQGVSVSDNKATLRVSNLWHSRNKQLRLQDAQTLWQMWASICSPYEPDKARIELVDLNGNKVGGSKALGGSLIEVID